VTEKDHLVIPVEWDVRSLAWDGDDLVDWILGKRYSPDGTVTNLHVCYLYRFDCVSASRDGRYLAFVERLGTKGVIIRDGSFLREINRSYYHADDYDYPFTFLALPDGSAGIAHCPNEYNVIEIEYADSGKKAGYPGLISDDFFHSRLAVSEDSRFLVSAGWIWQPFDQIRVYDLKKLHAGTESVISGSGQEFTRNNVEISGAVFSGGSRLVMTTYDDGFLCDDDDDDTPYRLGPEKVYCFDLESGSIVSQAPLSSLPGTLMPIGDYAVSFYEHPKILDLRTGEIGKVWHDIRSGNQRSSISFNAEVPPIATDPTNLRFAVASERKVHIIHLKSR